MKKILGFVAVAALLAGCGGGGGNDIPPGYVALGAEYLNQFNKLQGYQALPSGGVSTTFPASNSANYTGSLSVVSDINDPNARIAQGQANLTADFSGGGSVSGTAGGFYEYGVSDPNVRAVPGSATITSGGISGANVTLNVSGNVELGGVNTSFSGAVGSAFYGPNADLLYGEQQNIAASGLNSTVDVVILAD